MPRSDADAAPIVALAAAAARLAAAAADDRPALERECCALLDVLTPADLGLPPAPAASAAAIAPAAASAEPIRSMVVCSNSAFEIVAFIFPAGATIPLHDHPGMTVLSKVLYGQLSMRAYDYAAGPLSADEPPAQTAAAPHLSAARAAASAPLDVGGGGGGGGGGEAAAAAAAAAAATTVHRAVQRADTVLCDESPTFVLRPAFANVHAFEAVRPTVVVDLLLPPYGNGGSDCHYFDLVESGDGPELRVAVPPPSFFMSGVMYCGPAIS